MKMYHKELLLTALKVQSLTGVMYASNLEGINDELKNKLMKGIGKNSRTVVRTVNLAVPLAELKKQ
jgi:hypothetical protein